MAPSRARKARPGGPASPRRICDTQVSWAHLRPEQFAYVPCLLCGSFAYEPRASLVINWVEFFIVKCPRCGLMWRNPMPDPVFLHDLYAPEYFDTRRYPRSLRDQVGIPDATRGEMMRRQKRTEEEVRRWTKYMLARDGRGRQRKLLEIGGGRGYLQRAAQAAGWDTLGLEISSHGIKEAIQRRLTVIPVTLDELCDRYVPYLKFFDAIVFFDFLEHVTDPGRILRMVRAILKDDGLIILRVPCIDESDIPRFHLVDHIFHFSDRTLRAFLARENFTLVAKRNNPFPSGRFPGPAGQIQNYTYFANKA
jgi:SAM-dependent methyltransferase